MTASEILNIRYWDVFPKKIRVSRSAVERAIPLSIRGNPSGTPEFESMDSSIATVDSEGVVHTGLQPGATLIRIYDSWERSSVRTVSVEVAALPAGAVWMAWEEPAP
jgi:hypothetical protein